MVGIATSRFPELSNVGALDPFAALATRERELEAVEAVGRAIADVLSAAHIDTMLDVCDNILGRSFCALADGAVSPIVSGIQYFRQEFLDLCVAQPVTAKGAPGREQPVGITA